MELSTEAMIAERFKDKCFTTAKVADKTGIPYSVLQPCLKGRRKLRADEFFKLCDFLGEDPKSFRPKEST